MLCKLLPRVQLAYEQMGKEIERQRECVLLGIIIHNGGKAHCGLGMQLSTYVSMYVYTHTSHAVTTLEECV